MTDTLAQRTRNRTAKIYAIGIAIFIAIFGFVTVFAVFLAHLK